MIEVEDLMKQIIAMEKGEESKDIPDEPPPFRHEIDYVIRTWLEHKLHHTYPDIGGYNDQDSDLMDDWHIMNVYYARVSMDVFSESTVSDSGVPLRDIMRG